MVMAKNKKSEGPIMKATTHSRLTTYPVHNKIVTLVSNEQTLNAENKFKCLQLLQDSLDLKELLTNFASIVAKIIRPFNVRFQSAQGLFSLDNQEQYAFSNSYHLPLSSSSPRIGTITYQSNMRLTDSEKQLFIELHHLLIPCLRHALRFLALNAQVFKDHLTNIGNRAYYDESLQRAIEQSSRNGQPLSLMVFDIDYFKAINDNLGHLKGDIVLQHFAAILTKTIRTSDMAFRLGGDEFAVILQPGDQQSIDVIKARILIEINNNQLLTEINFSSSVGYAHWQKGDDANSLFDTADKELYIYKAKNR